MPTLTKMRKRLKRAVVDNMTPNNSFAVAVNRAKEGKNKFTADVDLRITANLITTADIKDGWKFVWTNDNTNNEPLTFKPEPIIPHHHQQNYPQSPLDRVDIEKLMEFLKKQFKEDKLFLNEITDKAEYEQEEEQKEQEFDIYRRRIKIR